MKKNIPLILSSLLFVSLASCGGEISSSISSVVKQEITNVIVDDSNVKKNYSLGEKFTLAGIKVSLMTWDEETYGWVEKATLEDYTSSLEEGSLLNQEGNFEVTITYQSYAPYTFGISVLDESAYYKNDHFSYASTTYVDEKGTSKPLNVQTIGENNENIAYLDSLGNNPRVLVVPYYFDEDVAKATEENRKKIEDVFFGSEEVAKSHGVNYSVASYYEKSSYGKVKLTGDVIPWMHSCKGSSENMVNGGIDASNDLYTYYVSEYNKENHGALGKDAHEWSYYDGNKDGAIDLVWFIYSKDMLHTGTNQWWAYTMHEASTYALNLNRPVIKTICWASFGFMWDSYDPHTYVHETGHAFGLEDYYCYNTSWSPMGKVDMMDNNLGDHNPYSKYALGWTAPLVVDEDAIITLKPFATSGQCVLLPSPNYNNSPFDEYFLLEFMAPVGLNKDDYLNGYSGLSGYKEKGLRVMHVDSRVTRTDSKHSYSEHPETGTRLAYDNSKFGRNSNNAAMSCTTDYWEGKYNGLKLDHSYALASVIPATFDSSRNVQSISMALDDTALFQPGTQLNFKEGWNTFLPADRPLWNKARSRNAEDEVVIDESMTINYKVEVIDIIDDTLRVRINVD